MDEIKDDNQNSIEENKKTETPDENMDNKVVDDILELAKTITELKKIKKRLQAQINFSKKGKSSKDNPQKEGDSPEQ